MSCTEARKDYKLICPEIVVCVNPYAAFLVHLARVFSPKHKVVIVVVRLFLVIFEDLITRIIYKGY